MSTSATGVYHGEVSIECIRGDITRQADMDVIVNAANAELLPGGGVSGAIHLAAGTGLADECRHLPPLRAGQAVITGAYTLPNRYVIHCLGPVYGVDQPEHKLLASCYRSALNLAETYSLGSIAFPAISAGIFGYPLREAAEVSLMAIRQYNSLQNIRTIRLVLWSETDHEVFNTTLHRIFNDASSP